MDCDVLIVGAGPAGAVTAKYAAEQGANVLVVDKKSEVGVPVRCGEGLPGTVLEDFGIKQTPEIVSNKSRFVKIVSPKGKEIMFEPHVDVCILNRYNLEKELVRQAEKKGAKFLLRTTAMKAEKENGKLVSVNVSHDDKDEVTTIKPRLVVGADGVESRVGRWIGLRTKISMNDIGTCAQYTVSHESIDKDVLEFWIGKNYVPVGFAWVFPKGENLGNVGIGMVPSKEARPVDVVDHFLKIRADGGTRTNFTVGCIPLGLPVKKSVIGNVILVGDAARQVMSLTGAGVANAFIAGRIGGKCIGKVATGKKDLVYLESYEERWRKAIEKKLKKSHKLRLKVSTEDRKIERFLRFVRFALGIYKLAPKFFGNRVLTDFHYSGTEDEA